MTSRGRLPCDIAFSRRSVTYTVPVTDEVDGLCWWHMTCTWRLPCCGVRLFPQSLAMTPTPSRADAQVGATSHPLWNMLRIAYRPSTSPRCNVATPTSLMPDTPQSALSSAAILPRISRQEKEKPSPHDSSRHEPRRHQCLYYIRCQWHVNT